MKYGSVKDRCLEVLPSYVYIINCQSTQYYKIGVALNVKERLKGMQGSNPHKLIIN